MKSNTRIESLQILRAFAFLGIFTSHCSVSSLGIWGVSVFFVLSGFLMVISYQDKDIEVSFISSMKFSVQKIRKLYSLHIITMIADLITPVILGGSSIVQEIKAQKFNMILNILLVQSWFPSRNRYFSMNAVAWFLSDMMFVYFCFPLALRLIKRIDSIGKSVLWIVIIVVLQFVVAQVAYKLNDPKTISEDFVKWMTYIFPAYRLGDCLAGGFLGNIFVHYRNSNDGKIRWIEYLMSSLLEIFAIAAMVTTQMIYKNGVPVSIDGRFGYCIFLPQSLLLVWVFARNRGAIIGEIQYGWLLFIGNVSAYAFLFHQVLIHYVSKGYYSMFNTGISTGLKVVVSLAITLLLSWDYMRYKTEKPVKSFIFD